jgi:serine/threonine protein kinase
VNRDFKPEDILLGADVLDAYLADAGFAKEDAGPEASKMKSASNSLGLTLGYLDPRVFGRRRVLSGHGWLSAGHHAARDGADRTLTSQDHQQVRRG